MATILSSKPLKRPFVGQHGLACRAVVVVADLAGFLGPGRVTHVMAEFGAQRPLDQRLLEGHRGRVDRFGIQRATDHLVNELFGYAG
jgi:hypothetical protein